MTTLQKKIEEVLKEAEEFGDLHEEDCRTWQEDECTCEMGGLKKFLTEKMEQAYALGVEEGGVNGQVMGMRYALELVGDYSGFTFDETRQKMHEYISARTAHKEKEV